MNPTGIANGPGAEALVGRREGTMCPHWAAMYTAVNQSSGDCPCCRQVMAIASSRSTKRAPLPVRDRRAIRQRGIAEASDWPWGSAYYGPCARAGRPCSGPMIGHRHAPDSLSDGSWPSGDPCTGLMWRGRCDFGGSSEQRGVCAEAHEIGFRAPRRLRQDWSGRVRVRDPATRWRREP